MAKTKFYSVGQVARLNNKPPRLISDLFWRGKLDSDRCPIIGSRRIIPEDYLSEIEDVIRNLEVRQEEAVA